MFIELAVLKPDNVNDTSLQRKRLFFAQVSPTYYILTAVAITDLLTMLSYLPYAVYFYCIAMPEPEYQHRLAGLYTKRCSTIWRSSADIRQIC